MKRVPTLALVLAAGASILVAACGGAAGDASTPATKSAAGAGPAEAAPAIRVGEPAPDFTLTDLDGKSWSLNELISRKKLVVLEWFNPDCPFVQKVHKRTHEMLDTRAEAAKMGAVWLAINSNAPGKQGSGRERNVEAVKEYGMTYPLLLDPDGAVGRLYGAKTTPHMFVIGADGTLLYDGAIDNKPSPFELGTVNYVKQALEAIAAEKPVEPSTTKPYGCSVKYAS